MNRPLISFTKSGCGKYFCECSLSCTSISPAQTPNPLLLAVPQLDSISSDLQDRSVLRAATPAARFRRSQATSKFPGQTVGIARPSISHPRSSPCNTLRTLLPVFPLLSDRPAFDKGDPYPRRPSGGPRSIARPATAQSDPESLPQATSSCRIRPDAGCKCNSFHPRSPGRPGHHSAETSVSPRSPQTVVAEAKSGDRLMLSRYGKFPFRPSSKRPPNFRPL